MKLRLKLNTTYDYTRFINRHFSTTETQVYGWISTLHYLCDIKKANEWQHDIKFYINTRCSAKKARLKLLSKGYFFNLKLFLLESSQGKDLKKLKIKYSISDRDYSRLKTDLSNAKFCRQLRKRAGKEKIFDWQNTFSSSYDNILKYVKYVAYNKLRFIAHSNNCNVQDLYPELLEVALKSFHRLYPTNENDCYVANYLKRSIHNRAINFIKFSTTKKRGRLINVGKDKKGENQFSLLEVGESKFNFGADNEVVSFEDLQCESDRNSVQLKFELRLSVDSILEKYKRFPKKYRFLTILLGNEDEGFTTWLGFRNLLKNEETNVEFQERVSVREFNQHLSKYLHVRENTSNVFILNISKKLGYNLKEVNNGERYRELKAA
jgi:hypothetical protein